MEEPQVVLQTTCILCNTTHTYTLPQKDYHAWRSGILIQDAFPYLSVDARELLISKICSSCFDEVVTEEESSDE